MGNCYGRGSSRRRKAELTKINSNGLTVRESLDTSTANIGHRQLPRTTVPSREADEPDGVPLQDSSEGLVTPFNTPAAPSTILDNDFDLSTLGQGVTHRLNQLSLDHRAHIHYVAPDEWSTCAYCNKSDGDRYGYFLCSSMSLDLLDALMENGWWRTGEVIFKPCFPVVCCPGYTLRLPIAEFVLKKQHRRVIRKWANFLRHSDSRWDNRHQSTTGTSSDTSPDTSPGRENQNGHLQNMSGLVETVVASAGAAKRVGEREEEGEGGRELDSHSTVDRQRESLSGDTRVGSVSQSCCQSRKRERREVMPGQGADPNKPRCRKAKEMRQERKQKKLEAHRAGNTKFSAQNSPHPQPAPPSLHDLLADHRQAVNGPEAGFKHKLEVKLLGCNPRHPELTHTLEEAYQLYTKFQLAVHPGKTRFTSAGDFEWGFMNSPVINPNTHLEGSYHMHYYLDNELVMISILDILPKYFVSIYFIYDPAIRFMTPGIYTVLVELDLVQQLSQQRPGLQYYALGYYSPNPKVSYKAQFKPQQILCNETNVFVPIESALPKLAETRYARLASEDVPQKEGRTASIDNLLINSRFAGVGPIPYHMLDHRMQKLYRLPLRELISETGSEVAHQMVISVRYL